MSDTPPDELSDADRMWGRIFGHLDYTQLGCVLYNAIREMDQGDDDRVVLSLLHNDGSPVIGDITREVEELESEAGYEL